MLANSNTLTQRHSWYLLMFYTSKESAQVFVSFKFACHTFSSQPLLQQTLLQTDFPAAGH